MVKGTRALILQHLRERWFEFYVVGINPCSTPLSEQRFIAMRGRWIDLRGPEGVVCMYSPTDKSERVVFFELINHFINH